VLGGFIDMKRHSEGELSMPGFRYHTQGTDKLYKPISFLFVTDTMAQSISAERELILTLADPATLERQRKLLTRYDPNRSAHVFHSVLRLFAVEPQG
jgi:hypothetical protein